MNLGSIIGGFVSGLMEAAEDHAEEICAGVAIGASIGAVAIAIKKTNDISQELDDINSEIDDIKESYTPAEGENEAEYLSGDVDENDNEIVIVGKDAVSLYKQDLVSANKDRAILIFKAYWPTVTLEAVTIVSVLLGRKVARDKQNQLAAKLAISQASIAAIQASYDQLRKNIKEKYGEEEERNLRLGLHKEKQEVEYTDEKGKTKKKKVDVEVQDKSKVADRWSRCFDEASINWSKDMFVNKDFLDCAESMFNKNLDDIDGYVTVNSVYSWLDVPQCEDGQVYGWIRDPENPYQINFGMKDITDEAKRRFVNGYERNIFIDFKIPPYYIGDKVWGKNGEPGIANKKFIGRLAARN